MLYTDIWSDYGRFVYLPTSIIELYTTTGFQPRANFCCRKYGSYPNGTFSYHGHRAASFSSGRKQESNTGEYSKNIYSFVRVKLIIIKYIEILLCLLILQASSIAVFGCIYYIIFGVVLLVTIARINNLVPGSTALTGSCSSLNVAGGGVGIFLAIIYFIDAIFCAIALCVRKK